MYINRLYHFNIYYKNVLICNEEVLKEIVKDCLSISEMCRKLNIRPVGGNYKTMKKYINLYNIDISHFTGQGWNTGKRYRNFGKKASLDEILVENSTYTSGTTLKNRLLKEGLLEYKCSNIKCGISEWLGEKIILHLDHINGNNMDNRLENLRLLCPNCHSQTDTYCNNNKRSFKQDYMKQNYDNRNNITKTTKKKKICKCGQEISNRSITCEKCYKMSIRKVERPSYEVLLSEISDLGYVGVGRKYGITCNAIRKWKKNYEKQIS